MKRVVIRLSYGKENAAMQEAADDYNDDSGVETTFTPGPKRRKLAKCPPGQLGSTWVRPPPRQPNRPPKPYQPQTAAERDAEELFGAVSAEHIAELAGVDITTARRWRRGRYIPPGMVRLLRLLIHGDLGAMNPAWQGWKIRGADLCGPDGLSFRAAEILAGYFIRQRVSDLESQLRARPAAPTPETTDSPCTEPTYDTAAERRKRYLAIQRRRSNAAESA